MKSAPDAPPSDHIHVRLLGGFRAERNRKPIDELDKGRTRALLAYLLLHRAGPISRQQLAYALWPDTSDKQALTNLRTLLFRLRRALVDPDRFLTVTSQTLHWRADAPLTADFFEFEQALSQAKQAEENETDDNLQMQALEGAVTLYRGDLLPACYDDWIAPERERLREAYLHALETLILLCEEARNYDDAIAHAQRLLRTDPLHEATYRRLIRLHALNGDRAGALRTYHVCADILQRELDVEPGPKTQEAYARLLRRDPEAVPLPQAVHGQARLVGRNREWSRLVDAWRVASAGEASMVAVTGEAGLGKTRLAEEMLAWAERQGIAVAAARCYATEDDLAYGPVIQWLQGDPIREGWADMDDLWLAELTRVIPRLHAKRPELQAPAPLNARWQRQRLFEAMARALLAGGRPLLLLLDDLQWSDADTLGWFRYLLQFDVRAPLLILATVRLEELADGHRYEPFRLALQRSGHLTEIQLTPLTQEETATLANELSDRTLTAEQNAALFRNTEGNPLFVVETMRAGDKEIEDSKLKIDAIDHSASPNLQSSIFNFHALSPKVAAVLQHRLAQLSPPAQELMQIAAVMGRSFTFDTLARVCEQDENALVDGLDEAWRRRIIREQGVNGYDFSHDKLRAVAYALLAPARRRRLHERMAGVLIAQESEPTDDAYIQIGRHFLRAGDRVQAARYYRLAAKAASRRYAIETMLSASTRALALLQELDPHQNDQDGLHIQATIIDKRMWGWEMVGDMAAYLRDLATLQAIGTALQDREIRIRSDRLRAAALIRLGRYREAEEMALANAARHQQAGALEDQGICLTIAGRARRELGEYPGAVAAFEEALALLDRVESFVYQIQAYSYLSTTYWLMGDYEQALSCGEQAMVICERESMPERKRFALGDIGAAATMLGRETEARQWLEESLDLARKVTDTTQEAFCRGHLGWLALRSGNLAEAEQSLQAAYELSQRTDLPNYASWLLRGLAESAAAQGRPEQARSFAAEVLSIAHANHQKAEEEAAQLLIERLSPEKI